MLYKYAIAYLTRNFLKSENSGKKGFPIKSASAIVFASPILTLGHILKILLYRPFLRQGHLTVDNRIPKNRGRIQHQIQRASLAPSDLLLRNREVARVFIGTCLSRWPGLHWSKRPVLSIRYKNIPRTLYSHLLSTKNHQYVPF